MLFFFLLAALKIGESGTDNIKYVPLKVTRVKTVGNVSAATVETRDIFDVINSNNYNFILESENLKEVNLTLPNGDTVLHQAVYRGSIESLSALLRKGVAVDLKDAKGKTAMWVGASKGSVAALKVLYGYGANINETRGGCEDRKRTLLHEAVIAANNDDVSWLVGMKLDLEARECDGWTPLHWAAFYGNSKTLEILLRGGANPNSRSDFLSTPLHWAAVKGHLRPLILLIEMGASLNPLNQDGWTPLHLAAQYGQLETVRTLLSYGAKKDSITSDNMTPLLIARYWGYSRVEELLRNAEEVKETPEKNQLIKGHATHLKVSTYIIIAFITIKLTIFGDYSL